MRGRKAASPNAAPLNDSALMRRWHSALMRRWEASALRRPWVLGQRACAAWRRGPRWWRRGSRGALGAAKEALRLRSRCNPAGMEHVRRCLSRLHGMPSPRQRLDRTDGAATLTHATARSIGLAAHHFPAPVKPWIITGGGMRNGGLCRLYIWENVGEQRS